MTFLKVKLPSSNQFAATMLTKLLNPPSVVKAESRMTQLHAVEKSSPWAAKFGWFNHGRCQKALALRGMKGNVRIACIFLMCLETHLHAALFVDFDCISFVKNFFLRYLSMLCFN
jgi:hypothetical protein